MKHEDVWRALDTLAAEKGLSPSGLARAAGLDPTSFNRSKRIGSSGLRWPSTESLSRVLAATGASLESFSALVGGSRVLAMRTQRSRHLPLLPLSQLTEPGLFDGFGHPTGAEWQQTEVPQPGDAHGYAVRIDSAGYEPVFREGGTLILSPEAPIRRLDRVLAFGPDRAVACLVLETLGERPSLRPLPALPNFDPRTALRLHRIVWTSL